MERSITDKDREKIINLGAFEYDAYRCADVLGWPIDEVLSVFTKPESDFFKTYQIGNVRAQYVIDLKLFEQAQQGDIKSLDKLEYRKKVRAMKKT